MNEHIVWKFMTDRKLAPNTSAPFEIGATPGAYDWYDVMPTSEHGQNNYPVENQYSVSFASQHPRHVFAYPTEEFAISEYSGLPLKQG